MAAYNPDVSVTSAWTDIAATFPTLSSAGAYVQCKSGSQILVAFSDAVEAPPANVGVVLYAPDITTGTATKVWVRSVGASAVVGSGLVD